ncbi:PRD domain-containing protein [Paenibacillus sp. 32352]|uniref:PRD domain-containing protein n=1 Tax=Paenibacillus sp. 32352 TaxID=1969111 RepID=UPI002118A1FF|nr:PRD domain-containing protein [Paenibacillus sp. 32352]
MKPENNHRIERVIGNNVILVKELGTDREYVWLGKGIGFGTKASEFIDAKDPRIEKRYRLDDRDQLTQYHSFLEGIDPEVIGISETIIAQIETHFSTPVNHKVYFALPSHIQFAIHRLRNGMDIVNPFLYETKMFFPMEYKIAQQAAELISKQFQINIPDDEVGFLTYHVHSAVTNVPVGQLVKFSSLINEMVETIEHFRSIRIPKESMDYVRLVTHLRFSLERVTQKKVVSNPFLKQMKKQYKEEYRLALELAEVMKDHLQTEIPEDEVGFLVMHLNRLFQVYTS